MTTDTIQTVSVLPYSKEAEEALIGAVIVDPDALTLLDTQAEEFYVHKHRWLWEALRTLERGEVDADLVTLTDLLQRRGQLEEIGGPAYIASLVNRTPDSRSAESYARIVSDNYRRRRMVAAANQLAGAAYDMAHDPGEATVQAITHLTDGMAGMDDVKPLSHFTAQVYDQVDERSKNPTTVWGISTGFKTVDLLLGGLQTGEVLMLGGVPGIGKSKLSVQVGCHTASINEPTGIWSLEMSGVALARRILSGEGKVITRHLKTGYLKDNDWQDFTRAFERTADWPMWVSDRPTTIPKLRAQIARLKARYGLRVAVIDYLLLIEGAQGRDDTEKSGWLSQHVKNMAKEFDVAIVSVSSVTKELMASASRVSNDKLRGSGQLIHDADVIAFLTEHLPGEGETKQDDLVTLSFTKGRELDAGLGAVDLYAHKKYPLFSSVEDRPEIDFTRASQDNGREDWIGDIYRG